MKIRDAGYQPVSAGGLDKARLLEGHLQLLSSVGRVFYRYAKPGEL